MSKSNPVTGDLGCVVVIGVILAAVAWAAIGWAK